MVLKYNADQVYRWDYRCPASVSDFAKPLRIRVISADAGKSFDLWSSRDRIVRCGHGFRTDPVIKRRCPLGVAARPVDRRDTGRKIHPTKK